MLGKFAAVLGPVLVGWAAVLTGSSRVSLLSIGLLFIVGALLLVGVDVAKGQALVQRIAAPKSR